MEKVIYAINDFQLPFPLTFSQMAWFVVSLFVVILFGELPPFNMIDGAFLKYFGMRALRSTRVMSSPRTASEEGINSLIAIVRSSW